MWPAIDKAALEQKLLGVCERPGEEYQVDTNLNWFLHVNELYFKNKHKLALHYTYNALLEELQYPSPESKEALFLKEVQSAFSLVKAEISSKDHRAALKTALVDVPTQGFRTPKEGFSIVRSSISHKGNLKKLLDLYREVFCSYSVYHHPKDKKANSLVVIPNDLLGILYLGLPGFEYTFSDRFGMLEAYKANPDGWQMPPVQRSLVSSAISRGEFDQVALPASYSLQDTALIELIVSFFKAGYTSSLASLNDMVELSLNILKK